VLGWQACAPTTSWNFNKEKDLKSSQGIKDTLCIKEKETCLAGEVRAVAVGENTTRKLEPVHNCNGHQPWHLLDPYKMHCFTLNVHNSGTLLVDGQGGLW
jgi:hypothetical protein